MKTLFMVLEMIHVMLNIVVPLRTSISSCYHLRDLTKKPSIDFKLILLQNVNQRSVTNTLIKVLTGLYFTGHGYGVREYGA